MTGEPRGEWKVGLSEGWGVLLRYVGRTYLENKCEEERGVLLGGGCGPELIDSTLWGRYREGSGGVCERPFCSPKRLGDSDFPRYSRTRTVLPNQE